MIIAISLIASTFTSSGMTMTAQASDVTASTPMSSYTEYGGAITILGIGDINDLMSENVVTGQGTYDDPFVIEGLEIEGTSGAACIYVSNLADDIYLTIRDCYLHGGQYGIELNGVENVTLENNLCTSNNGDATLSGFGININAANNITVFNNTCTQNGGICGYGVYVVHSSHVKITGNNCSFNSGTSYGFGIHAEVSDNINITNNHCCSNSGASQDGIGISVQSVADLIVDKNNCSFNSAPNHIGSGILVTGSQSFVISDNICTFNSGMYCYSLYIYNSNHGTMFGNTCSHNIGGTGSGAGILMYGASYVIVANNNCSANSGKYAYGMYLRESNNMTVVGNNCSMTTGDRGYGIYLRSSSSDNFIVGNMIAGNQNYGLMINSSISGVCSSNQIFNNYFIGNNAGYAQAYDNGTSNEWNYTNNGNHWSELTTPDVNCDGVVEEVYLIDGGVSTDYYPLVDPYVSIDESVPKTTTSNTVLVTGIASPGYTLVVNGVLVYVDGDGIFSVRVALEEGNNTITAMSINSLSFTTVSIVVRYTSAFQDELDDLEANATEQQAMIQATNAWLASISGTLVRCYNAENATADQIEGLLENVTAIRSSLVTLRASLNGTNGSLISTDANVTALAERLDDMILSLSTVRSTLQSEIDATNERISIVSSKLNDTRNWLGNMSAKLVLCYSAENATADQVSDMLANVTAMKANLVSLRSSLNGTNGALISTGANVTALASEIDNMIVELTSAETTLESVQSDMEQTKGDVSTLQDDALPMMLGALGLIFGLAAFIFVIVQNKKGKSKN